MRILPVFLLVATALGAAAQTPPDPRTLGPRVGEVVPDFELRDQLGVSRTLSSLMGPKGAMLVFYRSAEW